VGLRFRKSISLGPFRLNLSKSGIGASIGVPGFRVGTGPSGPRVTACIPGTGLGWTTGLGGQQRRESPARQRQRELEAAASRQEAADEVARFENQLQLLTSLHTESWSPWDWGAVAALPPPGPASGADEQERWQWRRRVAEGVLAGEVEACRAALEHLGPFEHLEQVGSSLNVAMTRPWCVEAWFAARTADIVPTEQLGLTPTGRLSRRAMPKTRYWAIYQDHVCSAGYRIGREVFSLLPIPVALVHGGVPTVSTVTGRPETVPVLSVAFDRETFQGLDLDRIDPSDALASFEHRMEFRKTTGFGRIELLRPEDLEVAAEPGPP
jgi:hypothetical protein